ncbi:MAG: beta-galactosidase [Lentisphaeria bacterium]|nr:beta-galactosidase [Lentisphaeria bacterium]
MFRLTRSILFGLCSLFFSAGVLAEEFFRCNFSAMEGLNNGQPAAPAYFNAARGHQSITGGGITGRAAIFAMENPEDFRSVARTPIERPLPAFVYTDLKRFPAEKGFCEVWIAPYFNQKQAWRRKEHTDFTLNYALTIFRRAPGKQLSKHAEKSEIDLYILKRQLGVRFVFSDGTSTTLTFPVGSWSPRTWHKVTICWEPGRQQLYVDRKQVAESTKPGTPGKFDALEVGGRDYNLSFQGLIDDIVIASGKPRDVYPFGFDGDPRKFPEIPVPQAVLEDWKTPGPDRELAVASENGRPVFRYAGGRESPLSAQTTRSAPVPGGSVIRADLTVRKTLWNYGSRAAFFLDFLDAGGKTIRKIKFDANGIGPGYSPMPLSELSSLCGINCDIAYFNYFRVPPACRSVRLAVSMAGNPAEIVLEKWRLRLADPNIAPWFQQPGIGRQLTYENSPAASDDEIRRQLQSRKKSVPEAVRCGDRIEWRVDGQKIAPVILHNPVIGSYARAGAFRQAGYRLCTSTVFLGYSPYPDDYDQIWLEDGSFDLSALEKAVLRVLREAPDACVILNLFVCPTARWLKENRGELQIHPDGNPVIMRNCAVTRRSSARFPERRGETWTASIHSKKYRRDMAAVLEKLFREFEKTDAAKAVVGVYVTGGDDGQFRAPPGPDMSHLTLPAFREFLREKYGTPEKLSAAWRKNVSSWQEIQVPTPRQLESPLRAVYSETGPALESDYDEFLSRECTLLKKALRAGVKKGAPRLMVGGYDNAMALPGSSFYGRGRFDMAEIIGDPFCDFLISLPAYGRERDECIIPIGLKAFTGSMRLHKKMIVTELDIRNPKQPPLTGTTHRSHNWQAVHDYRTFGELLKLCAGYSAAWGGLFHAFAMGRFWYDTPEALAAWKQAAEIAGSAPGEKLADDRIAWICGENFCHFFCRNIRGEQISETWSRNVSHALWLSQIRFDAYLPRDLRHPDFEAPKIMLFSAVSALGPKEIQDIRRRFLKDGRILIWVGTPSVFSGADLKSISDAVGFDLSRPKEIENRSLIVTAETHSVLKGVAGFLYSPRENAPVVHFGNMVVAPKPGDTVLAAYQGTNLPGAVLRRTQGGTEIFIGQPGAVSPLLLRNIAKFAGIRPVTEGNDLMVRGGGLIVLGASAGNGVRRVFFPKGVKGLACLTGQKIIKRGKDFVDVSLKYGECAVFKHAGETK